MDKTTLEIKKEQYSDLRRRFSNARILVIGDIIVDRYIYGSSERISPEAPVPVVDVEKDIYLLGGAANVVRNLHSLGSRSTICGVVGVDRVGNLALGMIEELGLPSDGIFRSKERKTSIKTRIVGNGQQIVRFDSEDKFDISTTRGILFFNYFVDEYLHEFDAVIISDYIKGMISQQLIDKINLWMSDNGGKPVIIDPKPYYLDRFKKATVITPNIKEAKQMSGEEEVDVIGNKLLDVFDVKGVLITRGKEGMSLFERDKNPIHIPSEKKEVFDVAGAGDTVVAVLTLGIVSGMSLHESSMLSNMAAGIVISKIGTATVSINELITELNVGKERTN